MVVVHPVHMHLQFGVGELWGLEYGWRTAFIRLYQSCCPTQRYRLFTAQPGLASLGKCKCTELDES